MKSIYNCRHWSITYIECVREGYMLCHINNSSIVCITSILRLEEQNMYRPVSLYRKMTPSK